MSVLARFFVILVSCVILGLVRDDGNGEKGLKGARRENARSRNLQKGDMSETSGE